MIGGLASLPWPIYMLFCGFHIGGGFFLTSCVQRQCGCLSCLTPERRVAQKKGCSGLDIKNTSRRRRSGDFLCQSQKNIPLPHVHFGKQLQLPHKAQVRIRWKWPPRYSGKPQDNIEIKMPYFSERHHNDNRGNKKMAESKRDGSAIPEQDNVRH